MSFEKKVEKEVEELLEDSKTPLTIDISVLHVEPPRILLEFGRSVKWMAFESWQAKRVAQAILHNVAVLESRGEEVH